MIVEIDISYILNRKNIRKSTYMQAFSENIIHLKVYNYI